MGEQHDVAVRPPLIDNGAPGGVQGVPGEGVEWERGSEPEWCAQQTVTDRSPAQFSPHAGAVNHEDLMVYTIHVLSYHRSRQPHRSQPLTSSDGVFTSSAHVHTSSIDVVTSPVDVYTCRGIHSCTMHRDNFTLKG